MTSTLVTDIEAEMCNLATILRYWLVMFYQWLPIEEFNITMSPISLSPIYLVHVFASVLIFAYRSVKSYHLIGDSDIGDL